MRTLIISAALLLSAVAQSQVIVQGTDINTMGGQYCEITGYNKSLLGMNLVVTID